jgi:hypothetical protein
MSHMSIEKVKAIYRFLIKETTTLNVQPSNTFILRAVPVKRLGCVIL